MTIPDRLPGLATLALHAGESVRDGISVEVEGPGLAEWAIEAARSADPVVATLEERVAALEGGTAAVAVASGTVASMIALHAILRPGDQLIAAKPIAKRSESQFAHAFKSFGWRVLWVETDDVDSFEQLVSPKTQAIFVESIADSNGIVADISALALTAKKAQVPLIVDNTTATPALCRPLDHGASIVIHSSADRLGGAVSGGGIVVDGGTFDWTLSSRYPLLSEPQADCGGIILGEALGNFAFAAACRLLSLRDLGAEMSPAEAKSLLVGMETLPLRMRRHSENARAVAEFLFEHKVVAAVSYAGLPGDRHYNLARRYCPDGAGAIVTVIPAGGAEAAAKIVARLKLFAPDGGGSRSAATYVPSVNSPADPAGRKPALRLSIGIEEQADLIADLGQAFEG